MQMALYLDSDLLSHTQKVLVPFFRFGIDDDKHVVATLRVHTEEPLSRDLPTGESQEIFVDTSLYVHQASKGQRWEHSGYSWVRIEVTNTWVRIDKVECIMDLYQPSAEARYLETIRAIKGLFTAALEAGGSIQIHSSAVVGRGGAILILGDMWHGKTTLLLEMMAHFRVSQLSCDTVVLTSNPGGGILISGWPSPFSVSHGTIADFPELYSFFPPERSSVEYSYLWQERKKSVLSSLDVVRQFSTELIPHCSDLQACIFARFAPQEASELREVRDVETLEQFLSTVYLGSRDPIYHNWHELFVCSNENVNTLISQWAARLLNTTPVYSMTWAPSAVSMLKGIPRVARVHKFLPRILDFSETQ